MAKVCLIVIDGWGISGETKGVLYLEVFVYIVCHVNKPINLSLGNAIKNASTPVMDTLAQEAEEYTTLDASGLAVGLPEGLMGNSEVGHFTIGTGRVVFEVSLHQHLSTCDCIV